MLLPIIGAGLGGYEAYRRSGGDIGATALGAGLGALTPGALRMAGTALGGTALGSQAMSAATQGLSKAGAAVGGLKVGSRTLLERGLMPQGPLPGLGALAAGTGVALGVPTIAGALAAKAAPAAKTAAGGAAGLGIPAMQPGGQFDTSGAVPGDLPVGAAPANTLDVTDPSGRFGAARTAGLLEGDVQLANMKKLMPYLFQAAEARSKTEFQRQLTAAGVRQNIATAANMLERSQQAAQQMGLTAAQQAGGALTSQYQYQ